MLASLVLARISSDAEPVGSRGDTSTEPANQLKEAFGALLAIGVQKGGNVLSYGGDSVLILFTGDDHHDQALCAANEMRTALDHLEVEPDQTNSGRINLRAVIAVQPGEFDIFHVGSISRELLVCGDTTASAVRIEAGAEPGRKRVSQPLAVRFAPALLTVSTLDGSRRPGSVGDTQVSVARLQLMNVEKLLADIGPADTTRHVQAIVTHLQRGFDAHGVTWVSTGAEDGRPTITAATGAVRSFENDDERLLRALRELLDYPSAIDIRIGVDRGTALCSHVRAGDAQSLLLVGDAVNMAGHLMSIAGPGELFSTAAPLRRSDTVFELTAIPWSVVGAKSRGLVVYRVGDIVGSRPVDARRSDLPLVRLEPQPRSALATA